MNEAENVVTYVGVDVHERESQLALFDPSGSLLQEKRMPTKNLDGFMRTSSFIE
jgi:hypothetical protein